MNNENIIIIIRPWSEMIFLNVNCGATHLPAETGIRTISDRITIRDHCNNENNVPLNTLATMARDMPRR